jgi:hypothetical protein
MELAFHPPVAAIIIASLKNKNGVSHEHFEPDLRNSTTATGGLSAGGRQQAIADQHYSVPVFLVPWCTARSLVGGY